MPPVPLAINAYRRDDALVPETLCVNFYLEEDKSGASPDNVMRIQRPGLTPILTTSGAVRGVYQQEGVQTGGMFAVSGSKFVRISGTTEIFIGNVSGSDRARFSANYEKLFLLAGGVASQYDGILSTIVMPDGRLVQDIDTLNNFALLACPDGRFYWLNPGEDVVDPLNFETAESSPDGLKAVRVLGDEAFFFGGSTIEPWQLTGNPEAPFLRAGGRTISRGCLARDTVHAFDNSLIWVGEDLVVYRLGNVPQRISDHSLEERLRKRTGDPHAMILEHDGHKFYVLTVPGQGSFVYDPASPANAVWPEFRWATGNPQVSTRLTAGGFVVGGGSKLYRFDPGTNRDDSSVITRRLTGVLAFMGRGGRQDSLAIGLGASTDFTLKVRWKDGQDDYPEYYDEMGARAPLDVVSLYRLGSPDQPYRVFDILIDEDVKVRISGAVANEAWR